MVGVSVREDEVLQIGGTAAKRFDRVEDDLLLAGNPASMRAKSSPCWSRMALALPARAAMHFNNLFHDHALGCKVPGKMHCRLRCVTIGNIR